MFRRPVAALCVAALSLLPGALTSVAQASVPPLSTVTVHGFLTRSATDSDLLVVNYTVTAQGAGTVTNAQLSTAVFPGTPVDLSTVRLDDAPVPSGTITVADTAMTVRIGLGADSVNGGMLGNRSYLLSYEQRRPTSATPNASTSATLTFTRTGQRGSVTSNILPLMHPDLVLSVPPGSGENHSAPLGTGRTAGYAANLTNRGGPADAVTLTIALPAGLRLESGAVRVGFDNNPDGVERQLPCTHGVGAVVTCQVGPVAHNTHATLVVPVTAMPRGKPGTTGTFHVSVAPTNEPDQKPADNSLAGHVSFTGIAVLHVWLTPSATRVPVGRSVTIAVHIRNDGPQAASDTLGVLITDAAKFRLVKITTNKKVTGPEFRVVVLPAPFGSIIGWNVATLAAHHTATAQLTMKATAVGNARIEFFGNSSAGDPRCDSGSGPCGESAALTLHAVRATRG